MTERQQQIMEIGKGMMEPIFMGQLPELMKNYKNAEGLELRRQSLQNGRMYHWILSKVLKMAEGQ